MAYRSEIAPDPIVAGEAIEAYWPDDDTWLPAKVLSVNPDLSLSITWSVDSSESDVPADLVRRLSSPHTLTKGAFPSKSARRNEEAPGEQKQTPRPSSRVSERSERPPPLARLRGAQRDTTPAWMTKGVGIGTSILGEATGELLKPGLTKTALEEIERRGRKDMDKEDPFGDVFSQSRSGRAALDRLEEHDSTKPAVPPVALEPADVGEEDETDPPEPLFVRDELLSFDGTAAAVADMPYVEEHSPAGSFSVDFWTLPRGEGAGYRSPLTSRDCPPPRGYAFFITPKGMWSFWVGLPESKEWLKVEGPTARQGKWQRLTGAYCHRARTVRLFVDGKLVGHKPALASTATAYEPNTRRPLRLGAGASEGVPKFTFQGDVRGVRVYGKSLREPLPAGAPPVDGAEDDDGESLPPAKRRR